VEAYIVTAGNGTEACRRAGYRGNTHTLKVQGSRLLSRPHVLEALRQRMDQAAKQVHRGATREEVVQILSDQLRGGRFFTVDKATGEPVIDLRAMEEANQLHLVKKVTKSESSSSGAVRSL
jgi:phage terminase small subunit